MDSPSQAVLDSVRGALLKDERRNQKVNYGTPETAENRQERFYLSLVNEDWKRELKVQRTYGSDFMCQNIYCYFQHILLLITQNTKLIL